MIETSEPGFEFLTGILCGLFGTLLFLSVVEKMEHMRLKNKLKNDSERRD